MSDLTTYTVHVDGILGIAIDATSPKEAAANAVAYALATDDGGAWTCVVEGHGTYAVEIREVTGG